MVPSSGLVLGPSPMDNASRSAVIQATVQQPRTHGRVFALIQQKAQTSNAIVEGAFTLSRYTARTLFDPGTTHSFISNAFANELNKSPESLQIQLIISTPLGTEMVARTKYGNVKLLWEESKHL